MRKNLVAIAALAAIVSGAARGTVVAQVAQEPSSPTNPKKVQNVPLELQVVIARYQGDKRVSSLPYVLSLKSGLNSTFRQPGQGASLRLGSRVPIRAQIVTPASDGKPATTANSVNYENVGTNIDCAATLTIGSISSSSTGGSSLISSGVSGFGTSGTAAANRL